MTDEPNPSRSKIAAALVDLSERVASFPSTPEEDRLNRKLAETMQRVVGNRGKVISVVSSGPGDWSVVFNTEYAGLKAFYDYRYSKGVRLEDSKRVGAQHRVVLSDSLCRCSSQS